MFDEFIKFIGQRAYREGAVAFTAGAPRHPPPEFGTYSGYWVDGYDAASLADALPQ
jgi:hypothetical protein